MNKNKNWFINLHSHTLEIMSGDEDRDLKNHDNLDDTDKNTFNFYKDENIYYKNFFKRLVESKIRINAITNHNIFDINQYEEILRFQKEQKEQYIKEILIIPGIEYSVKLSNNQKFHMIIISNPDKHKEFFEITKNIRKMMIDDYCKSKTQSIKNIKDKYGQNVLDDNGRLVSYKPLSAKTEDKLVIQLNNDIEIEKFFSELSILNPIITFHYSDKRPAIRKNDLKKLIQIINDINKKNKDKNINDYDNILSDIILLADVPNYRLADYEKDNFRTIISADNKNWKKGAFNAIDEENYSDIPKAIYGKGIDSFIKLRFFLEYYNLDYLNMSMIQNYINPYSELINKLKDYDFDDEFIDQFKKLNIPMSNLTTIFGERGSGKSLILDALFIYFRENNKKVIGYNLEMENGKIKKYFGYNTNELVNISKKYDAMQEEEIEDYKSKFSSEIKEFNKKYINYKKNTQDINMNILIKSYIEEGFSKDAHCLKEYLNNIFLNVEINFSNMENIWKSEIPEEINHINKTYIISNELFKNNITQKSISNAFFKNLKLEFTNKIKTYICYLLITDFLENMKLENSISTMDRLLNSLKAKKTSFNFKSIFDKLKQNTTNKIKKLLEFIDISTNKFNILYKKNLDNSEISKKAKKFGFIDTNKELFYIPIISPKDKKFKQKEVEVSKIITLFNSIDTKNKIEALNSLCDLELTDDLFHFKLKLLYRLNDENFQLFDGELSQGQKSFFELNYLLEKNEDKDIFLIDEPEKHFDTLIVQKYISRKIKNLVKQNKTIIISSHNNILNTITVPASIIYTRWDNNKYLKYQGTLLSNRLINLNNEDDIFVWTDTIIKILEGGKDVYNLKKEIYEKIN